MKGLGILSLRWATAAIVAAALVAPQALGAQVPNQGIKVHGHWVIEVRNADGTLQLRREFENALDPRGKMFLAQVLSGAAGAADHFYWTIYTNLGSGCPSVCAMVEPSDPSNFGIAVFKNLTKTIPGSGLDANQIVLQGSFVASSAGQVSDVSTSVELTSGGAFTGVGGVFTQTFLPAPIPVQATQTVSVTVTISFS